MNFETISEYNICSEHIHIIMELCSQVTRLLLYNTVYSNFMDIYDFRVMVAVVDNLYSDIQCSSSQFYCNVSMTLWSPSSGKKTFLPDEGDFLA